jgi:hypothetical protein
LIFIVTILVIIFGIVIYSNKDDISELIGISTKETYDSISILTDGKSDETKTCNSNKPNLIWALEYNDTVSSSTDGYCVSGKEDTCKASTCYMDKSVSSCPAGTIILYRVNDDEIYYFNVLHDDGETMTLQSVDAIVQSAWGTSTSVGPVTALTAITEATNDWSNVNDLTYTLGQTVFLKYPNNSDNANPYTYCSAYNRCTSNSYILSSDLTTNVKARFISIQEAADLGCTDIVNSCPKWLPCDIAGMFSLQTSDSYSAWYVRWTSNPYITYYNIENTLVIKPVVEINK